LDKDRLLEILILLGAIQYKLESWVRENNITAASAHPGIKYQ